MLQPKPQQNITFQSQKGKPQEGKPQDGILPGGVIEVDANGFGSPFSTDFDFGLTKPFGFGDLLASFNKNQWWKG